MIVINLHLSFSLWHFFFKIITKFSNRKILTLRSTGLDTKNTYKRGCAYKNSGVILQCIITYKQDLHFTTTLENSLLKRKKKESGHISMSTSCYWAILVFLLCICSWYICSAYVPWIHFYIRLGIYIRRCRHAPLA